LLLSIAALCPARAAHSATLPFSAVRQTTTVPLIPASDGFCYINAFVNQPANAQGAHNGWLQINPDHSTSPQFFLVGTGSGSATCYRWSDFTGGSQNALTFPAATGSAPNPITVGTNEKMCFFDGLGFGGRFNSPQANAVLARLDLNFTNPPPPPPPWSYIGSAGAMARCTDFGVPVPTITVGTTSLWSVASGQTRAGTGQPRMPRADEAVCVLVGLLGNIEAAPEATVAGVFVQPDGYWELEVSPGTGVSAAAECFALDLTGSCHSMDTVGDTHVCPTNLAAKVQSSDPYCARAAWDNACVIEADCLTQVCEAAPECCHGSWTGDCDLQAWNFCDLQDF
jgi:hypothetical protein